MERASTSVRGPWWRTAPISPAPPLSAVTAGSGTAPTSAGGVIAGNGCVIGHSTEVKGAILLNRSNAPHFAYLGDSILGHRANLGAGTKLSNLTLVSTRSPETGRRPTLQIRIGDRTYDTGLTKLGAILGDDVQTGCNCVTHPGCLVGPRTLIYANVALRKGYTPSDSLVKLNQATTVVTRHPKR